MSDQSGAMPLGLIQQKVARSVDPAQLEMMGKKAAALHTDCGKPLSDSVMETVKEAQLSPEQVKRVCEFANTSAYLSEFEKAGEVRNITFEGGPANPGDVLRGLNDGSAPAINQVGNSDYDSPTDSYKTASAGYAPLAELFGCSEMEKNASVGHARDHFQRENPVEEVYDMRVRLEGTKEHFMSKLSSSDVLYGDVRGDLCDTVQQELMNGDVSMGDVARVWSNYAPTAEILKYAMVVVGEHLKKNGMDQKDLNSSLTKFAQANTVPDPEHPLVERFIAFTKIAHEHKKLEQSIGIVDEQLAYTNNGLKALL